MRKEPELQKPVKAGSLRKDRPTDPKRDATEATKQAGQNLTLPQEPCPQCGAKPEPAFQNTRVIYHKANCPAYGRQR